MKACAINSSSGLTKDPVEKRIYSMQGHGKVRHFGVWRELDKGYGWNEILNRTPMYGKQSLLWQMSMQTRGSVAVLVAKCVLKLFIFSQSKLKGRVLACFCVSAWHVTCPSARFEGKLKLFVRLWSQNFLDRSRNQLIATYHLSTYTWWL